MRQRSFVAVAAVFVLAAASAAPALADYGPTVVGGTSSNSERKLAFSPDGTLFATYTQAVGNTTGVFVKRSSDGGANWQVLPRLGVGEAFRSCVAVDSQGVLHVAWTEFVGPDRQVFYAHWTGSGNWTGLQQMSDTPGYSGFPSLAVDDNDHVHLAWYGFDGTNYQIFYRFQDSTGWKATVQATHGAQDANNPAIVVGEDNYARVSYFSYVRGDLDVWYIEEGAHGWSAPKRVNIAGAQATDPSMAIHGNAPAVAYVTGANETMVVRYDERDVAGNWSAGTIISVPGEGGAHPSLVVEPATGGVAVLYENASGAIRLRARVDGVWGATTTLATSGDARWVSALWVPWTTGPAGGKVVAVWTEGAGGNFTVNFGSAAPFQEPPCRCGPDLLSQWAVPLLFVLVAGASVGALAIASARTRGGGRG